MVTKNILIFLKRVYHHKMCLTGAIIVSILVLMAIFAPFIAPNDPNRTQPLLRYSGPAEDAPLGRDHHGRCVLSRIIFGSRISLQVGLISVGIGMSIGATLGLIAAFYGKWVNVIIMRLMDAILAVPGLLIALVIIAAIGPSLQNAMIAIGIASFPIFARLMRGQVLSLLSQEFIASARASGASNFRIMARHILPNAISPLLVMGTLRMASAILTEASLSFLGLGAQPPTATWGGMISASRDFVYHEPLMVFYPGVMIIITVIAVNLMGDGIRDILDPRVRGRA